MIYMSREKALKILNEPNGPEKLAAKAEQAFVPAWALYIRKQCGGGRVFMQAGKAEKIPRSYGG